MGRVRSTLLHYWRRLRRWVHGLPHHLRQGRRGEDLAASFLRHHHGFRLLVRNWRWRRGEIDLICARGDVLIFVEVRSRRQDNLVRGLHSISPRKRRLLRATAQAYLRRLSRPPRTIRFDVVEVVWLPNGHHEVRHLPGVL